MAEAGPNTAARIPRAIKRCRICADPRNAEDDCAACAKLAEWYFPGRRGAETERDRRGGYAKALKRACERADVHYGRKRRGITFHHATRRTGATRMIRRGGEKAIAVVQRIGGWKTADVLLEIYQETNTAEMRAAVESVAARPVTKRRRMLTLVPKPAAAEKRAAPVRRMSKTGGQS